MRLVDPTVAAPYRDRVRAPRLAGLDGLTIGLLGNRKANADVMLRETAALFEARHGCRVSPLVEKTNASAPAPPGTLESVFEQCDFLITGMGD